MRTAAFIAALDEGLDELDQVLGLLRAAGVDDPASLPLGAGDRRLLDLHRTLVGSDAEFLVTCGTCGAISAAGLGPDTVPAPSPRMRPLGRGGGLREPTYADLEGLPDERGEAAEELLRRCTIGSPERPAAPADLEHVDDSLAGPLALDCVGCGVSLQAMLDVQQLVLRLLQRHAAAVDAEVHLLARTYHWDLAAIEALPDERRARLAGLVADEP